MNGQCNCVGSLHTHIKMDIHKYMYMGYTVCLTYTKVREETVIHSHSILYPRGKYMQLLKINNSCNPFSLPLTYGIKKLKTLTEQCKRNKQKKNN